MYFTKPLQLFSLALPLFAASIAQAFSSSTIEAQPSLPAADWQQITQVKVVCRLNNRFGNEFGQPNDNAYPQIPSLRQFVCQEMQTNLQHLLAKQIKIEILPSPNASLLAAGTMGIMVDMTLKASDVDAGNQVLAITTSKFRHHPNAVPGSFYGASPSVISVNSQTETVVNTLIASPTLSLEVSRQARQIIN